MRPYLAWDADKEPDALEYFIMAPGPRAAAERIAPAILGQAQVGRVAVTTLKSGRATHYAYLKTRTYWVLMKNVVQKVEQEGS